MLSPNYCPECIRYLAQINDLRRQLENKACCYDCKHYIKSERDMVHLQKYICELTLYDGGETQRKTLAIAEDAEGYYAALYVQPNFSCIQFERKAST